ncbi:30S ribosomal protein S17 [Candidatus Parcubacteria bacterium]|nr:30S ribosomal protein S17 [Patescibacteria group bacterium]MCG2688243.1 30S ribosomal protein S17 [Candidatus Parcubacteria bacterium]
MPKRKLTGIVVSDKMSKTVVIKVQSLRFYPKYKARYKVFKKYQALDENNLSKVGETVTIEECRPLSKNKKWRVVSQKTPKKK